MVASNPLSQDRYRIGRQIGRGGTGTVYEAYDLRLWRTVALKETLVDNEAIARAAQREAHVLSNLSHPNLPRVLDHYFTGEKQVLIMEFIQGDDLQALLERPGAFSANDILRWTIQLLRVLEYLHAHVPPVVHRDIKPANLKINSSGEVVLLDFGLAKGTGGSSRVTASRSTFGYTLNYAPPEQIRGELTDPRSDLYSLAATMYHMLTGKIPPDAFSRMSGMVDHERDPLVPLSRLNPEVPSAFASVIEQALSLNSEKRPRTATVMLRQLLNASPDVSERAAVRPVVQRPVDQSRITVPINSWPQSSGFAEPQRSSLKDQRPPGIRVPLWVYASGLVLAVAMLIFGLYSSRARLSNLTAHKEAAPRMTIPIPYSEAQDSVVALEMKDGAGQTVGTASGFFVSDNEILAPLTSIEGAIQGQAILANETFAINSVAAVDRERGLAILKVSASKRPLTISKSEVGTEQTDLAVLGRRTAEEEIFIPRVSAHARKDDGLIEVTDANVIAGAALLNDRGEVVGLMKSTDKNVAVSSKRILALLSRPRQVTSLATAGANKLLHDFRKAGPEESTKQPAVGANLERSILTAMFGSYLTDETQCPLDVGDPTTPEGLRDLRKSGYLVPSISSNVNGSFTKAGAKQTAYVILVGECGAPHVVNWGTKRLAIFEGQTLVANVDVKDYNTIIESYDLDGDGISELLLAGAYMQMGHYFSWAELVDARDGKLHVLKDFKDIVDDPCGNPAEGKTSATAAIYYTPTPGQLPEFRVDRRRAKCSAS